MGKYKQIIKFWIKVDYYFIKTQNNASLITRDFCSKTYI